MRAYEAGQKSDLSIEEQAMADLCDVVGERSWKRLSCERKWELAEAYSDGVFDVDRVEEIEREAAKVPLLLDEIKSVLTWMESGRLSAPESRRMAREAWRRIKKAAKGERGRA